MDAATRRLAQQRAGNRCEYCQVHEDDDPAFSFHIEHIIPKKHGGSSDLSNLAWSCHYCNRAKGSNIAGFVGRSLIRLFPPRRQQWQTHFRWKGATLIGKTKCGQATVQVLNMNAKVRRALRDILVAAGEFPPK
jgi:hypothetical protein